MPEHLNSTQLDAIQRLICEPLREAVRTEMAAGHERLATAIERVADQLAGHIADALRRERAWDARVESLERRVTALERFRGRILIVYAALTVLLSFAWSVLREFLLGTLRRR